MMSTHNIRIIGNPVAIPISRALNKDIGSCRCTAEKREEKDQQDADVSTLSFHDLTSFGF
jgi:hypothetical protein